MITSETAAKIWECHREIHAAHKLLDDLKKVREDNEHDPYAQNLRDCFGRMRGLELGIPSGQNSHQLYKISPRLAESVIKAHIANKEAELIETNEQARIELDTDNKAFNLTKAEGQVR